MDFDYRHLMKYIPKLAQGTHNFIIGELMHSDHEAYIVGGCIRDVLMGKQPKDWDICTSATPEEVEEIFADYKIIETGLKHGTVTVVINDDPFEITTFRTEGEYSDGRHPDKVEFVTDIMKDLSRRDFTINAIAYNAIQGFVDPFGGIQDIQDEVLRCVGDPDERFQEDALRILRAMRFASVLNFHIEDDTYLSMHFNKQLLKRISAERIQSELCKMLLGDSVCRILLQCWEIIGVIIPEMQKCFGFTQNNKYHQYTVYGHIAHAVANYKGDDVVVKVALLLHDIGKPQCYSIDSEGHGHFYGHSEPSAKIAAEVVKRLKFDNRSQHDIVELVQYHDVVIEPTPRIIKRWMNKIGLVQFMRLMDIRLADILAHSEGTQESRIQKRNECVKLAFQIDEQNQCFQLKDLAINGKDLISIGFKEGKELGDALRSSLDAVIDDVVENEKSVLLDFVKSRYSK